MSESETIPWTDAGDATLQLTNGEVMYATRPDGNVPRYTVAMLTGPEEDAEVRWYLEFDTAEKAQSEWNRWKGF